MSAEPLPTPAAPAARARRTEGLTRAVLGRPGLSLVPTPTRARRAPFVALILGILLLGLIGLLLLNTASAQDAFRLHRLQLSAANVNDQRQEVSEAVNQLPGPAGLAAEAQKLGMVPIETPAFWKPGDPLPPGARVLDGLVVVPAAGTAAPPPAPRGPRGGPGRRYGRPAARGSPDGAGQPCRRGRHLDPAAGSEGTRQA